MSLNVMAFMSELGVVSMRFLRVLCATIAMRFACLYDTFFGA